MRMNACEQRVVDSDGSGGGWSAQVEHSGDVWGVGMGMGSEQHGGGPGGGGFEGSRDD